MFWWRFFRETEKFYKKYPRSESISIFFLCLVIPIISLPGFPEIWAPPLPLTCPRCWWFCVRPLPLSPGTWALGQWVGQALRFGARAVGKGDPSRSLKDHARERPGQTSLLSKASWSLAAGITIKKKILNSFYSLDWGLWSEGPHPLGRRPSCANQTPTAGCVPTALGVWPRIFAVTATFARDDLQQDGSVGRRSWVFGL